MALDDDAQLLLATVEAMGRAPLHTLSPQEARRRSGSLGTSTGAGREVRAVEEVEIPTLDGAVLAARVYRPIVPLTPPAVLVYFHAGGWVLGGLDGTTDLMCRELCAESGLNVLSVAYRLAPEHRFPTQVEDAWNALVWASRQGERLAGPGRLVVGGESAGGNLAAAVTLRARDRGRPVVAHQLLICAVLDHDFERPSYQEPQVGLLTADSMRYFWSHYLEADEHGADPLASPLRAPDLSGLPPATIITAEFDPLRDEGEAYAARLAAAGVEVSLTRHEGTIHGFCSLHGVLPKGKEALRKAAGQVAGQLR